MAVLRKAASGVRWLLKLEIGIWRSLFLWVTRRVPGLGPGAHAFSYARQVSPIIGAFIFVSLVELPVVHLLLPWEAVRIGVLVISVWGLLWMVGLLASMKVFPHLIDDAGLRIRYGTTTDIRIPWEAVASVTARRRSVPTGRHVHLEHGDDGATVANVAVMKQTRVDVVLRRPTAIALPDGTEELTGVRFYVDDAGGFVATARERLADREPARR
ncbi:MAG TPA: hypothetical protein VEX67_06570 [Solirubrobacteraceae bacterium]|nr:hypothetical protein [Solirubrobacteraceae bacterium]